MGQSRHTACGRKKSHNLEFGGLFQVLLWRLLLKPSKSLEFSFCDEDIDISHGAGVAMLEGKCIGRR